jgi:ATP-dependent Clp protease ATP-binding subunit ClpA
MFSKELELSISQAYQEAREQRHEFLTIEHMLLALLIMPPPRYSQRLRRQRHRAGKGNTQGAGRYRAS